MRTKVYTFKPKGCGTVYATSTSHSRRGMGGRSSQSNRSQRCGVGTNFVCSVLANFIVRGIFGMKK